MTRSGQRTSPFEPAKGQMITPMVKAEATLELVSKIRPAGLRLHSEWAKQAAKVAQLVETGRKQGEPMSLG